MRLSLALLIALLATLTLTKKGKRDEVTKWSHESIEEKEYSYYYYEEHDSSSTVPHYGLDFNGTLKRSFALNAMLSSPERSLICSPVSALLPLGKLVLGSEPGDSRNEMLKAIGVTKTKVKRKFRSLMKDLQFLPGVVLSIASRLFVPNGVTLTSSFQKLTKSVFQSSCEKVDFSSPVFAADFINKWVNSHTKGMIPDLLKPSDIEKDSSVIIVNAIYFGGMWKDPFRKVFVGKFHSSKGVRQLPMMSREGTYKYGKSNTLGSQIVEIPYAGNRASFIIVLPEVKNGLDLLLQQLKLAPELLNEALRKSHYSRIKLTMPKFKIQSDIDLKRLYKQLGVRNIFSEETSGLSRIDRDDTVYISTAKQKCIIEVTEKATEASAASIVTGVGSSPWPSPEVLVDRPFLFFIKIGREQLFSGIFVGPQER